MTGERRVRWGVLGAASIATRRVIPALQASAVSDLVAIASRDPSRARAAATAAAIPRAVTGYDALLGDPAIDAVYIPLPNHLHLAWSLRALDAGKHVLCEKPIGLDATEARALRDAALANPGLLVMEAFMYRFHPRWRAAHALVREGAIGRLATVATVFSYDNQNPDDIRNRRESGGGALLDIGCYGVSVARWLFGREPTGTCGVVQRDATFGTDILTSGVLDFAPGIGTFLAATQLPWHQHVTITGSAGRIEIARPFNPVAEEPSELRLVTGNREEHRTFPPVDQYREMVDQFSAAILERRAAPVPIEDAVANMTVIDAVFRSGASGTATR